jgi:hypothetical protein
VTPEELDVLQSERLLMRDIVQAAAAFIAGSVARNEDLAGKAFSYMRLKLRQLALLAAAGKMAPFPELADMVENPPGAEALDVMLDGEATADDVLASTMEEVKQQVTKFKARRDPLGEQEHTKN